ncbi:MAG: YeaH/YhbH family protein [Gammaproteobacteria bacterium]
MSQIIDRRLNGKNKSAVNRQRFLQRYKEHIKKSVSEAISKRNITDIEAGETIKIPTKDIHEPQFHFDQDGNRNIVLPGNKEFVPGDRLPRTNEELTGKGSSASNTGEGEDEFSFQISKDEFLDLYFDDLALPELVKKQMTKIPSYKLIRAGYTTTGVPTNINIIRSLKGALGRRISIGSYYKKQIAILKQKRKELSNNEAENKNEIEKINDKITQLKNKIKKIPFIDTFDLRYNNRTRQLTPTTQAVMFCIMDVSGSMDKAKKDIAKRFFVLLYLFLKKNYQKIDLVFIRHHTSAKEVNEEEFFYSRETGGTVVSSSLQLFKKIMSQRYDPENWNIYAAQASDGDNWNADSPFCYELLNEEIIPYVQYYAYVEIMPRLHQSLWESYLKVKENHLNFAMQTINELTDIYPVFRELFKRQQS